MYTSTLRRLVKNISSLFITQPLSEQPLSARKQLRGIVISGPETREWAHKLNIHVTAECMALYPNCTVEIETLILDGSPEFMQQTLMSHRAINGNKKDRCSFIITPGYTETQMVTEMRKFYNLEITHVYCVQGAKSRSFFETQKGRSGVHNTPMNPTAYVHNLEALIPNLKTVCLAYSAYREQRDEYDSIQGQRRALKAAFSNKNIKVIEHVWDVGSFYQQELQELLPQVQALVTLDEPTVYRYREEIIDLCNAVKIPLCTSELDSVFAGAAIGCGITFDSFAKPVVSLLHDLMANDTDGYVTSMQIPMQIGMRYNKRGMADQGIEISVNTETLMLMKSIYDGDIISL